VDIGQKRQTVTYSTSIWCPIPGDDVGITPGSSTSEN